MEENVVLNAMQSTRGRESRAVMMDYNLVVSLPRKQCAVV